MRYIVICAALVSFGCVSKEEMERANSYRDNEWYYVVTNDSLQAICDTNTGNLIYTRSDSRAGIAVVPNGCEKKVK